ncbi:MAG: ElyC/SanA/YdcF family protein, partial [Cyanobacteria bacterium P01_H01_bin.121]
IEVQKILQQQNFQTILLVTSATHMPRSMAIFTKLGIQATPAPTDFLVTTEPQPQAAAGLQWQEFLLRLAPNADSLNLTTRALKEYLGYLIYALRGWL